MFQMWIQTNLSDYIRGFWTLTSKTSRWKTSISTYFVLISSGHPLIYRSSMMAQGKQNVSGLCTGESIKLHAIMLTNAVRTMLSFTWRWPNMDFHEAQVPVYINECKSSLIRPWLERAACWKRQEVGGMLITHWHIASQALPVLALKNYLDYWPKDWSKWWQESFLPAYFDQSGWLWLIR